MIPNALGQTPGFNGYGVTLEDKPQAQPKKKRGPVMNALSAAFEFGAPEAFEAGRQKRLRKDLTNALQQNDMSGASNLLIEMGDYKGGLGLRDQMQAQRTSQQQEQLRMAYESTKLLSQEPDTMRRFQMAQQMSQQLGLPAPTDPAEFTDDQIQQALDTMRIKGGFGQPSGDQFTLAQGQVRFDAQGNIVANNPKEQGSDEPWYITEDGVDPRYVQAQAAGRDQTVINNNMGADGEVYRSISDVPEGEPIPTALLGGYKPDTGFFAIRSAESPGGFRMEPYDGGKVGRADENRQLRAERSGGTVVQDIGRALEIESQPGIAGESAVGPVAGLSRHIPGTPAHRVHQLVESALSNIGIDQLQAMRDASPTGGALGQIPVQQQARLEQMLGSLQVQQNDEDWENNARRAVNIYLDIIHGPDQGPERFDLNFDYMGRPLGPRPEGVSREEWLHMDPEDRELFQ